LLAHLQNRTSPTLKPSFAKEPPNHRTTKNGNMTHKLTDEKEHRSDNITYTQAGVSCFVGQVSDKFEVQFFVRNSVVKIPACV